MYSSFYWYLMCSQSNVDILINTTAVVPDAEGDLRQFHEFYEFYPLAGARFLEKELPALSFLLEFRVHGIDSTRSGCSFDFFASVEHRWLEDWNGVDGDL